MIDHLGTSSSQEHNHGNAAAGDCHKQGIIELLHRSSNQELDSVRRVFSSCRLVYKEGHEVNVLSLQLFRKEKRERLTHLILVNVKAALPLTRKVERLGSKRMVTLTNQRTFPKI